MNEVQTFLCSGDFFAAVEQIQRSGTAVEIADRYASLLKDLYWKQHDLPSVVAIGRAGILYCLGQSLIAGLSPDAIQRLRSTAKGLAYDVGSFTWPGWEEPGIQPTPDDLTTGRQCARLNLRLAIELNKPAEKVSMAHWLVGAHALANHDADSAVSAFRSALETLADQPEDDPLKLYNRGCAASAELCGSEDEHAASELAEINSRLQSLVNADAKVYLAQLQAIQRLFVDRS
jgi:hypothetical protein